MSNYLKVWTYGDSLSQPREGIVSDRQRYITLLREWLMQQHSIDVRLYEHQRGDSTVTTLYEWFENDWYYFNGDKADILVIHCGICDCAPRPIPPKVRGFIRRLPEPFKSNCIKIIRNNRKRLQSKGIFWRRVNPDVFESTLLKWIIKAKDIFDRIYIINIAPTNDETEEHSPGLKTSIEIYNELINNVMKTISEEKIRLININHLICEKTKAEDIDEYIIRDDGHHITEKSHQLYFKEIIKQELEKGGNHDK